MDEREWDKNTRILVCDVSGNVIGMIVDSVDEVLKIPHSTIEPTPDIVTCSLHVTFEQAWRAITLDRSEVFCCANVHPGGGRLWHVVSLTNSSLGVIFVQV